MSQFPMRAAPGWPGFFRILGRRHFSPFKTYVNRDHRTVVVLNPKVGTKSFRQALTDGMRAVFGITDPSEGRYRLFRKAREFQSRSSPNVILVGGARGTRPRRWRSTRDSSLRSRARASALVSHRVRRCCQRPALLRQLTTQVPSRRKTDIQGAWVWRVDVAVLRGPPPAQVAGLPAGRDGSDALR